MTQQTLAQKVGVARSYIATIELGRANPSLGVIVRLAAALGLELELGLRPPIIVGDRRQRDAVHARCSGYVDRRLRASGLETAREVPIVDGRWRGWIDLLAFDRRTATLIIIEIKTVIDDMGAIERQIGWYERSARLVARDLGWQPRRIVTWFLVLSTADNEGLLLRNRDVVRRAFPIGSGEMDTLLHDFGMVWPPGRALALIDPARRGRSWLIRPRIDGGRTVPHYADYRAAAASLEMTRPR